VKRTPSGSDVLRSVAFTTTAAIPSHAGASGTTGDPAILQGQAGCGAQGGFWHGGAVKQARLVKLNPALAAVRLAFRLQSGCADEKPTSAPLVCATLQAGPDGQSCPRPTGTHVPPAHSEESLQLNEAV